MPPPWEVLPPGNPTREQNSGDNEALCYDSRSLIPFRHIRQREPRIITQHDHPSERPCPSEHYMSPRDFEYTASSESYSVRLAFGDLEVHSQRLRYSPSYLVPNWVHSKADERDATASEWARVRLLSLFQHGSRVGHRHCPRRGVQY